MKTKEEIKKWLLKNCVDEDGNLDLSFLDFSDFDGDVYASSWKVKRNLYQDGQMVNGNLFQNFQVVKGDLWQNTQKVEGDLCSHKLEKSESWEDKPYFVRRIKLQSITRDELAKIDYILKD